VEQQQQQNEISQENLLLLLLLCAANLFVPLYSSFSYILGVDLCASFARSLEEK